MAGESAARAVIQDLVDGGASPGKILQFVGRGMGPIGEEIGAAATVGAAPEVVVTGEEAGVTLVSMFGWWLLLILLIVLLLIRWFEGLILRAVGSLWIVGGPMRRIVGGAFSVLDGIENEIIKQFEDAGKHVIFDLAYVILICLGLNPDATRKMLSAIGITSADSASQAQINHLQKEIDYLRQHMGSITYQVSAPPLEGALGDPIWARVRALEENYARIRKDLVDFDVRIRAANHLSLTALHQVQTLESQVRDVRAESAGWQDIQGELNQIGTELTQFANAVEPDLARLHHVQTQMAPLGMLLEPGLAGLQNLRKLEDNICQCPKIPGLPRLQPELLAMYEFMSHG